MLGRDRRGRHIGSQFGRGGEGVSTEGQHSGGGRGRGGNRGIKRNKVREREEEAETEGGRGEGCHFSISVIFPGAED